MLIRRAESILLLRAAGITILVGSAILIILQQRNKQDTYHCNATLNTGGWLDTVASAVWKPQGCALAPYKKREIEACLKQERVLFVGDSIARNLFEEAAYRLDPSFKRATAGSDRNKSFTIANNLRFIWDPYLRHALDEAESWAAKDAMIVVSSGMWALKNEANAVSSFQASLEAFIEHVANPLNLWSKIVLLPLSHPAASRLSEGRAHLANSISIDQMNEVIRDVARSHQVAYANAVLMMQQGVDVHNEDGLHYDESVNKAILDLLLNYRCNDKLVEDGLVHSQCCASRRRPLESAYLLVAFIIMLLLIIALLSLWSRNSDSCPTWNAILIIAAVGYYCGAADRSILFTKAPKHFVPAIFAGLHALALLIGWSTRLSVEKDPGVLSRQQTDEWKGWMQIMILLYHYYGASSKTRIYIYVRCLVAAYLFMTGYGHTQFFLKKGDFSLQRFASVLVRLSLLTCYLAVLMDNDVLFYYFPPLVTFWYCCIFITMLIGQKYNKQAHLIMVKIMLLMSISTFVIRVSGILEAVGDALRLTCNVQWDMKEWRFRLALDLYAVPCGMLFAVAHKSAPSFLERLSERTRYLAHVYSVAAAVLILLAYALLDLTSTSKYTYNALHPFLSPFAVVAFVVLRNATPGLRKTHSRFFAFWGQISLETYILQCHIWLADDTKHLLQLPFFDVLGRLESLSIVRFVNMVLATLVFVWVAYEVAQATTTITKWLVENKASDASNEYEMVDLDVTTPVTRPVATPSIKYISCMLGKLPVRMALLIFILWFLNIVNMRREE